jgi:hypothetical protein
MAKSLFRIIGGGNISGKIAALNQAYGRAYSRAVKRAGLLVQREAQKKTPVDTGLLRKSAKTAANGSGFDTEVQVSFSTNYAIYVHEDLEAYHEVGEAKFLERAATEQKPNIIAMVKQEVSSVNP